jgi:hypothetical protein
MRRPTGANGAGGQGRTGRLYGGISTTASSAVGEAAAELRAVGWGGGGVAVRKRQVVMEETTTACK